MKTIVFATGNVNKAREIKEMLPNYNILTLSDIGFEDEIDECADTTRGNAEIKVKTVLKFCEKNGLDYGVIGDDTGLFIDALDGQPGVHSARFGGYDHDQSMLRKYLLERMSGKTNRDAYFECTIVYGDKNITKAFEGRCYGKITTEEIGNTSFGYDCVFYSSELKKTFGEAEGNEKNSVSHRGRAIRLLIEFLNEYLEK